jgi:hypothetical protein
VKRLAPTLLVLLFAAGARADDSVAKAADALRAAAPGQARLDAAKALVDLGPGHTADLVQRLGAPRAGSTDEARRAVLKGIGADVPAADGTFKAPPRVKGEKQKGELDWLAALAPLPADDPAVVDALEVVGLLRALAKAKDITAARAVLDYAFTPDGTAFRDECGRQIRAMSPHSIPALLRASQDKKAAGGSFARYAAYQLDRMEKNRPAYALAAAPDDALEIAMLDAIREVRHPDAVTAVLDRTNSPTLSVRKAAREAWLAYVTGPPPPPAPKAKRKMAGNKLSDEALPLYLTYREFADQELRRVLTEKTGAAPDARLTPEQMTTKLWELYDAERAAVWDPQMKAAADLLAKGDSAGAVAAYDAILMQDPTYARRATMVPAYLALGKQQAEAKDWDKAVLTYHKAYSIDPAGEKAKEAESSLFYARAARAKAHGESSADDLARARQIGAADDSLADAVEGSRKWMLWAGLGAAALALALGALALGRRRAT